MMGKSIWTRACSHAQGQGPGAGFGDRLGVNVAWAAAAGCFKKLFASRRGPLCRRGSAQRGHRACSVSSLRSCCQRIKPSPNTLQLGQKLVVRPLLHDRPSPPPRSCPRS
eukprot:1232060-Rhodomonas_salina.1